MGPVRAQVAGGEQQVRAVGAHDPLAFLRGGFGHDQPQPVALDRADHGQTDARVARGGLDHDLVRGEFPALFGGLDHGQGHPVLHGSSGVGGFYFRQDIDAGTVVQPVDGHQGGMADGGKDIGMDHGKPS